MINIKGNFYAAKIACGGFSTQTVFEVNPRKIQFSTEYVNQFVWINSRNYICDSRGNKHLKIEIYCT